MSVTRAHFLHQFKQQHQLGSHCNDDKRRGFKKNEKNMCKKIFKNEGKRSDCPYWLLK